MRLSFRLAFIFLFLMTAIVVLPKSGRAATYDIQELTPAVKAALDNRRERFEQLRGYKEKGVIGEDNRGYVYLLIEGDAGAEALVSAENKDRRVIYTTILTQNKLADSELAKVEQAFAQVQRDKANPGDKIQDPDGRWVTK